MDQQAEHKEKLERSRARTKELQKEFAEKGDALGWFDALYAESGGNNELIPWADLEPNVYLRKWVASNGLRGDGRTALVVGCGLGDDAGYLHDLGFEVTGFDISPNAIDWAKRIHEGKEIRFEVADLFKPPGDWVFDRTAGRPTGGFDFVLEIYTIQPLPIEMRPQVIDAISGFVGENGSLLVVTRGREDDETPDQVPWPVSRGDLRRFESNGLSQVEFTIMPSEAEDEPERFVVEYSR